MLGPVAIWKAQHQLEHLDRFLVQPIVTRGPDLDRVEDFIRAGLVVGLANERAQEAAELGIIRRTALPRGSPGGIRPGGSATLRRSARGGASWSGRLTTHRCSSRSRLLAELHELRTESLQLQHLIGGKEFQFLRIGRQGSGDQFPELGGIFRELAGECDDGLANDRDVVGTGVGEGQGLDRKSVV